MRNKVSFSNVKSVIKDLLKTNLLYSLFDDGNQRYSKLRVSAQRSIISQVGLSFFFQDKATLNYEVDSFNFYLCPRSCGNQDQRFLCQASSIEFLTRHNFDFNKVKSNSEKEETRFKDTRA